MPKVSIVIPAYNEEASIGRLLEVILSVNLKPVGFEREILVIDNGSHDKTGQIASQFKGVKCLRIEKNRGKGAGTAYGIENATGDWVLIQDADLEYDPHDYVDLLRPIKNAKGPITVYGSRTLGQLREQGWTLFPGKHPNQSIGPWVAGWMLSLWAFLLYGRFITDTLTGYKVYPMKILKQFNIQTFGFETDHELTGKLQRSGVKIVEVPIHYRPRSIKEGKKIRPRDFFVAVATFLKFRFAPQKNF